MSRLCLRRAFACLLLLIVAATTGAGCGYSIRPPFSDQIRTVYVPVFRSVSFRRDVNLMLTEAVQKEIIKRTPYKVVGKPEGSDATLEGSVNFADKNLIVENPFNFPRQLNAKLTVAVTYAPTNASKRPEPVVVSETVNFIPEIGESSQAAFQKACDRLALQIVSMMEEKW
jgi:hypothetical protein